MTDIGKIDKNFNIKATLPEDMDVYNIKENEFALYGLMFDDKFRRMPENVAKLINEGVYALHTNTSGGRIRFVTDSPYIALIAKMPNKNHFPHMPQTGVSGFDLYCENRFCYTFIPPIDMTDGFEGIYHFSSAKQREITINFPLYNNVENLYIGIRKGCFFGKASDYKIKKKIIFYGSSITQGGCVSRPGLSYPAQMSQALSFDYINLGFSGSARGEIIMAEYIAGLHPDILIMDYDHNAPTPEHLDATHEAFFKSFRNLEKITPVVFISAPNICMADSSWIKRRDIIKRTYTNAKKAKDENVFFIDGEKLWGKDDWDACTMDCTHPNDIGHYRMAKEIIKHIKYII